MIDPDSGTGEALATLARLALGVILGSQPVVILGFDVKRSKHSVSWRLNQPPSIQRMRLQCD